jgi:single-stranded-DNA-specific exonuclease
VRASCRSIPGFHITQALDQWADLLVRYGGHESAAGFTVLEENLGQLREKLAKIAWQELAGRDLRPTIRIDKEVSLEELHPDLLDWLEMLQPTGQSNPYAVFCSRKLQVVRSRTVGNDKTHLKFTVKQGDLVFDAIAFRFGHLINTLPARVDLAYQFDKNVYNGRVSLQLKVLYIKASGTPD